MAERIWDKYISTRDREIFEGSGYGKRGGLGRRPAVLVVDLFYNFTGDVLKPITESIGEWRNSCGEEGWAAVYKTAELLEAARSKNLPIIYSNAQRRADGQDSGRWKAKNHRAMEKTTSGGLGTEICKEVAPQPKDIQLLKLKPSMFFGTPLVSILNDLDVDTVLVTGLVTSGCVRATVTDAFSYNFSVGVIEDCCGDRWEVSHAVTLFEMDAKYADVISLQETKEYLGTIDEFSLPNNILQETC
ncbi:MAG TPA: hydrolase [Nitrospinae bacterium]|nr:hydrolase [Nitrospinota bacterium]